MNNQVIEKIISFVQLSPTGDNAQEFLYQFNEETKRLSILLNPNRANSFFNPNNNASSIALGMHFASLKIASLNFGYNATILNIDKEKLSLEVEFLKSSTNSNFSLNDLRNRYTNRNSFRELTPEESKKIHIILEKQFSDNDFKISPKLTKQQISTCLKIDSWMWKNKNAIQSLFKWVHLFKKDYSRNASGLYWKELGVGLKEWPTLFLFKHFPALSIKLYKYILSIFIEGTLEKNLKSSSFIFLNKHKDESLIEFGEKVMYFWITINKNNFSCQPMSLYTFIFRFSPELLSDDLKCDIDIFLKSIHFSNDSEVFWIFRLGTSEKPSIKNRLRLLIDEVLSYK